MNYIDDVSLTSEMDTCLAIGELLIKESFYMEFSSLRSAAASFMEPDPADNPKNKKKEAKNKYKDRKEKIDEFTEKGIARHLPEESRKALNKGLKDMSKSAYEREKDRIDRREDFDKALLDNAKEFEKGLNKADITDRVHYEDVKKGNKALYKMTHGKDIIDNANSFWVRVWNWFERTIKTIFAKLRAKEFHKQLDKCQEINTRKKDYLISDVLEMEMDVMSAFQVDTVYKDKQLIFDKRKEKGYRALARMVKTKYDQIKRELNYSEEREIKVRGTKIKKYVDWMRTEGDAMASELPNLNRYLKELSKNISDEEKNSSAFRQYVQLVTYTLELNLKEVKVMIDFLKYFNKHNETSDDDDTQNDPNVKRDQYKNIIVGEQPDWTKNATLLEDMDEIGSLCRKGIHVGANKYVRDKYPNADKAYVTRDKKNRKLLFAWNAEENGKEDWRIRSFRETILSEHHLGSFEKEIFKALDKYGSGYLVFKK